MKTARVAICVALAAVALCCSAMMGTRDGDVCVCVCRQGDGPDVIHKANGCAGCDGNAAALDKEVISSRGERDVRTH